MPKVDWLWLAVGIAIGLLVGKGMTHPKSPVSGIVGTKFAP